MVTEQAGAVTNRSYPPPSNVTAILGRLRNRNLPEVVDADYLRDANIPEGTNSRRLFALRFLGLIRGAGEPSPALRSIATATDEEYMSTLAEVIREGYTEVFVSIDPSQDTQATIVNFFRRYTPASQRDRMVIFFLGMCREAGIPTLDVPRQRSSGASPGVKQQRGANLPIKERRPRQNSGTGSPPPRVTVAPALDGLMQTLPPAGTTFPQHRREQWIDMVRTTLAFLYPDEAENEGAAIPANEVP